MEFHHKRPNGCIRSVSEILFQLLCGKLLCTISRQNILPEQPFFFCDFSFRKSSLIYLKISFRRDCIHLQAVIDLIAEVKQKGSHIRIAGNQSISLHAFVGFVICVLVFSDAVYYYTQNENMSEGKNAPMISVSASVNEKSMTVTVANCSLTEEAAVECSIFGFKASSVSCRILTNEAHSYNDFDCPDRVSITEHTAVIKDNVLKLNIPPCAVVECVVD